LLANETGKGAAVRLQLTRRGDYGVRAMLELGRREHERVSGTEISRSAQIPLRFINQVMGDLVRAGLVESRVGRSGGYRLARPAAQVSILSIVEAIEGDTRRRTCVLSADPCARETACEVHALFTAAQNALVSELSRSTLADALS
jgi:Rrf2 family protein